MEGGGKDGGMEGGGREGVRGGWEEGAHRCLWWWALNLSLSSFSLSVIVICHCHSATSSILIIHCLWWVVFVACQWWWPFSIKCGGEVIVCICECPSSFMGGWDGRSSSLVGLPGLWAIVLWLFGGLPFIGSGGEQCSFVVSGGGCCRLSIVVGALLSVFADAHPLCGS